MSRPTLKTALRALVIAIALVLAAGLLTAAYGGGIDPDASVLPQLLGLTFPLWIAANVAMLPVAFVAWRRAALLPAAALLAALPSILTIAPLNIAPRLSAQEQQRSFTLMTYNGYCLVDFEYERAGMGRGPEWGSRTIQQIIALQPDIVLMQESGGMALRYRAQLDSLRAVYPYVHCGQLEGECLFSKYPFTQLPTPQPLWPTAHYSAYQLNVEGHELLVVNCHLQSIGLTPDDKDLYRELTDKRLESPTRSELSQVRHSIISKLAAAFRLRAEQARHIRRYLDEHPGPAILVGDFNDVQLNYAYRCIRQAGMRDAYADAAFGPTITYIDNRFYFHIDQILYRGDLDAVAISRGHVRSSDHYPLTATFLWQQTNQHNAP